MLQSPLLAGVVAGIPISLLCLAYVVARRERVVRAFTEGDASEALSPSAATALAFGAAACSGPVIGLAAAVVHGWLPAEDAFAALALGLATVFSLVAVATRTPMVVEKVVLNFVVAVVLGVIAPRLVWG